VAGEHDTRLVDYLYGELSKQERAEVRRELDSDAELKKELESFEQVLADVRAVPDEEPSAHLDSLILAHAREGAEKNASRSWLRRLLRMRAFSVAVAGALAALVAVVVAPTLMMHRETQSEINAFSTPTAARAPAPTPPPATEGANAVRQGVPAQMAAKEGAEAPAERAPESAPRALESRRFVDRIDRRAPSPQSVRARSARPSKKDAAPANPLVAENAMRADDDAIGGAPAPANKGSGTKTLDFGGADVSAEKREVPRDEERVAAKKEIASDHKSKAPAAESQATAEPKTAASPPLRDAPSAATLSKVAPQAGDVSVASPPPSNPPARAQEMARSMIAAANSELQRGDRRAARTTLLHALDRVARTPATGDVLLRIAELDEQEEKYPAAIQNAQQASLVRGFMNRAKAIDLVERVARKTGDSRMVEWAKSERSRATNVSE
jgi:hypothetical protein